MGFVALAYRFEIRVLGRFADLRTGALFTGRAQQATGGDVRVKMTVANTPACRACSVCLGASKQQCSGGSRRIRRAHRWLPQGSPLFFSEEALFCKGEGVRDSVQVAWCRAFRGRVVRSVPVSMQDLGKHLRALLRFLSPVSYNPSLPPRKSQKTLKAENPKTQTPPSILQVQPMLKTKYAAACRQGELQILWTQRLMREAYGEKEGIVFFERFPKA